MQKVDECFNMMVKHKHFYFGYVHYFGDNQFYVGEKIIVF